MIIEMHYEQWILWQYQVLHYILDEAIRGGLLCVSPQGTGCSISLLRYFSCMVERLLLWKVMTRTLQGLYHVMVNTAQVKSTNNRHECMVRIKKQEGSSLTLASQQFKDQNKE